MTFPSHTYCSVEHAVFWGTKRLDEAQREALLTTYDDNRCAEAYWELHEAHLKAGGIPRCTSLRAA